MSGGSVTRKLVYSSMFMATPGIMELWSRYIVDYELIKTIADSLAMYFVFFPKSIY